MVSGAQPAGWTDERVETLKKLWMEGLSASQIAGELGEGVTRNAVIGKVHRLKLSARAKPTNSTPRARPAARPAPRRVASPSAGIGASGVAVRPSEVVAPDVFETRVEFLDGAHRVDLSVEGSALVGTNVVHT